MPKQLSEYLRKSNTSDELIWNFAFLGRNDNQNAKFTELAELAEPENWTSSNSKRPNDILYSYITHTFERAFELGDDYVIINEDESYACFNTGLLTDNGEDIICLFNTFDSSDEYHWHLFGFRKESNWDFLNNFSKTPLVPHFFTNPQDIYFDPNKELIKNLDHILEDNIDRFEGRKLILRTEISDNSILEKVKIGTKVDFYGSSGFIPGSYTCKDTISLFTEGGITIPEEGNKYDRKLYGKIINNDGLPETILIEFDKKVVTFQELDLKVRKALYDKKTLVSR